MGLATALVFGVANALWALDQPDAGATQAEIADFYAGSSTRIIIGGSLSLAAIALFVPFASGLRAILREHEGDDLLATTAFGGALLLLAAGIGAETINLAAALRAEDGELSGDLGQALFEVSYVLGFNGAGVGIGILLLATAAVALRSGTLMPRALAWFTVILGIAFLTPLSVFLLAPAVVLLAVVSVLLLRSRARPAG